MSRDQLMRRALWATAVFNMAGAFLFAFPYTTLGQFAGFPGEVPLLYRLLLALFVILFGGTYAWLASQPAIDRPLVVMAMLGKFGAFVVVAILWLAGEVPSRGVLALSGDLAFAATFAWWLLIGAQPSIPVVPADAAASRLRD